MVVAWVIMNTNRHSSHSVIRLTVHVVWVTKYRYHVLQGAVQKRCRTVLVQMCDAEDIRILKGVISNDHGHMLREYPPSQAVSDIVKRLKGRTSRVLQQEFPDLRKRYWGKHVWAVGYGAWSSGTMTDALGAQYREHHRSPAHDATDPLILE